MKILIKQKWTEPLLLLVIAVMAYGLLIPWLGIFGDDWPHFWVLNTYGLEGLNQLVAWDRPFSAWVYWLIAPIGRDQIWIYHTYLLLLRWIGSVLFFYLVKELLPESEPLPFWAASFFLLYPGFRQSPQPLEFILHFTVLNLFLVSNFCMVKAAQGKSRTWLSQIIGTIAAFSMFSVEYFIGLELLRPVFLLFLEYRKRTEWKNALKRVILFWSPYILVLLMYAYWRVFVFKFPTYKPTFLNQVSSNPINAIMGLGQVFLEDFRAAILGAWRQIFSLPIESSPDFVYFVLTIVAFIIIFLFMKSGKSAADKSFPLIPLIAGLCAVVFAGIPFWITGIPVQLDFPWDRSTLPFMVGASLILCGFLLLLKPEFRNFIAALLISFSIGMHYQSASNYQVEWNKLSQFFWQLTWRAPSLKSGTIVLSDVVPLFYYGDNNLTPVLNWTYAPENKSTSLPYNFFDMGERLGKNLPELKPDLPVEHGYRFVTFKSNSNNLLPVFYKEESCLKIVNKITLLDTSIPKKLRTAAKFSNPDTVIQKIPVSNPPNVIPEPVHDWCYYYQKAELNAQFSDWEAIRNQFSVVKDLGFSPVDKTEWVPFIHALAVTGDTEKAEELSEHVLEQEGTKPLICATWAEIILENSQATIKDNVTKKFGCD